MPRSKQPPLVTSDGACGWFFNVAAVWPFFLHVDPRSAYADAWLQTWVSMDASDTTLQPDP